MARGRMISYTVATDKRLNSISEEAELVFLKTIPHLDRDGIILGDPDLLAARVCPRRPRLVAMIEDIIQEWIGAGLVIAYVPGEDQLLFFPGFTKNQVGMRYEREPGSIFPPPPGFYRNGKGVEPNGQEPPTDIDGGQPEENIPYEPTPPQTSGKHPANIRQTSGSVSAEKKGIEGNRREGEDNVTVQPARASADQPAAPPPTNFAPESLKQPGWSGKQNTGHRLQAKPCTHFDPRKLVGGYIPKGTGENGVEVFFEFHAFDQRSPPSKTSMERMNEIDDLAKWRQVLEKCALANWKPGNIGDRLDAYQNGFRHEQKANAPPAKVEYSIAGML